MKALLLAGGYATRLRPLSCTMPKLLFPIAGKPIIEWNIDNLLKHNVNEIILAVNYMADKIEDYFNKALLGLSIKFSFESMPLGTGGAIKNAKDLIGKNTFIAMNGDIISQIDITSMMNFHKEKNASVTIAIYEVKDPSRFGLVKLNEKMKIESFIEKPKIKDLNVGTINAGIYIMEPEIFEYIPSGKKVSIEKEVFPRLVKEGKIYGYLYKGLWFDIGKIEDFIEANKILLSNFYKKSLVIEEGTLIDSTVKLIPPILIKKGVEVKSNSIIGPNSIINSGTIVEKGSKIENTIIFNNSYIGELSSITGAIIGEKVYIGKNVKIGKGCIISGGVFIHDNISLAEDVIVCPYKEIDKDIAFSMQIR
ncbi:MAG: NDP-sugar synthase [Candidatus Bathyarchaeia archaeon]